MKRDLVSFALWSRKDLDGLFRLAEEMKQGRRRDFAPLEGKTVALIFERESLRTRVSFEVGITQLGGHPIFLQQETIGIATRESVHDIGAVVSQYNEAIVARTTRHQTCVQLAESATVPVINALTDLVHPCQILADALTLRELGAFHSEKKIAFVGHGNNIVNSWLELAEKFPLHFVVACPAGYEPHPQILEQARAANVSRIEVTEDPEEAAVDADVVYTDVWPHTPGMDEAQRLSIFRPYQINAPLLRRAKPGALVMHRLPANRGEEITREILDGKNSVVLKQAGNRLHIQKAVLTYLVSRTD